MKKKAISIFLSVLFIISSASGRSVENLKRLIHCPADSNSQKEKNLKTFNQAKTSSALGMQTITDSKPIIEINSNITTNQVWTANNVYWVTTYIYVSALLVIEPGTIIMFGDDYGYYDCGINVNNGGTLISKGTPDNPIIWTCDFLYPDWGNYWQYLDDGQYYYCPIFIEETASPATTVSYNFIEGAVIGIVTDNIKLDRPIEHNYLIGNLFGVGEYGTKLTDIKNNLCYYNYYSSIDVYLSDANGNGDTDSVINIAIPVIHIKTMVLLCLELQMKTMQD